MAIPFIPVVTSVITNPFAQQVVRTSAVAIASGALVYGGTRAYNKASTAISEFRENRKLKTKNRQKNKTDATKAKTTTKRKVSRKPKVSAAEAVA